ncbi:MAG: TetR/AcrR family transcriptional regulator [Desulfobacterales bacterium]|nr:TetR/AcrR family transcriptional regulator [Desulfobacterales bacterium]MCP4160111.1 TetR/AcrR family transcriptional regulator [Deltaproteobacteria bacterium]
MNWQRARTDEKKNERKEAIHKAAFTLFKKNGYDNVSFNGIASEAGFTKSNMYRYFSSREEIFLNVFADLFEKWFEDCIKGLQKLEQNEVISNFSKTWVKSLMSHPQFLDLTPILFVSLEKNSSYEQLLEFKKMAKNLLYKISIEISRIYPEIEGEKAFRFLTLCHAATSNYWAAATQNEALKKIYQQDMFKELKPNFEKDLTTSIEIFIQGIKAS